MGRDRSEGRWPVVLGGLGEHTDGSGLLSPVTWAQKGSICLQNVFPQPGSVMWRPAWGREPLPGPPGLPARAGGRTTCSLHACGRVRGRKLQKGTTKLQEDKWG